MRYKILNILALVTLASCTETIYIEKDAEKSPYLNGECKTPIAVGISYNEGSVQTRATRAANGSFASGDNLIAYVRHVTAEESGTGTSKTYTKIKDVNEGQSTKVVDPKLATLSVQANVNSADNYTANNLTVSPTLYWDDFSNSADASTDLRTEKHYLQSYYGYCYNGGTPSTVLTEATGELGWTIEKEQNTKGLTTSDLLWSSSQDPVPYAHATFDGGVEHGILTVPYSHAMSKVTIEVNLADGFSASASDIFSNTSIDLLNMNTVANVNAPAQTIVGTTPSNITMKKLSVSANTDAEKRSIFEAIIVPTPFTNNLSFATIKNVEGNNYDIKLTTEILNTAPQDKTPWEDQLSDGGTTIPGVNYKLVVTISKQEIKVVATIADWTTVNAAAEGEINFSTDITENPDISGEGKVNFTDGSTFDLYKSSNPEFSTRSTIATYSISTGKWTCAPIIYWQNKDDNSYFRALSPSNGTESGRVITENKVSMDAGEGTNFDLMWGTTAAHSGTQVNGESYSYEQGDAIKPRTKDVPLIFYHKTSKVKIVLQTPPTDADGKVTLKKEVDEYAKIQFTNLFTTNTVNLHTGELSNFGSSDTRSEKVFAESTRPEAGTYQPGSVATETAPAVDDKAETAELFMIPQEITDNSRLIITLADGTTYSLQLNACKTIVEEGGTPTAVEKWEEGKSYVYYIHLTKEAVQFIAVIQNWEEKEAGGSASMDWDDVDPDLFEGGLIETRKDGWKN